MVYKIGFVGPDACEEAQGLFAAFPTGFWCCIEEEVIKQVDPVSGDVQEETAYVVKFDNVAMMQNLEKGAHFALSVRTLAAAKAIAEAFPALLQLSEHAQSIAKSYE